MGVDFSTSGCGVLQPTSDWHPLAEALFSSYQTYGASLVPQIRRAYNNIVLSGLYINIDLIIGTDITTGDVVELTETGMLKVYEAFGWPIEDDSEGYDFTDVEVIQIAYGGAIVQGILQNTTTGTLDFTDINGLHSGTITLGLKIILQ